MAQEVSNALITCFEGDDDSVRRVLAFLIKNGNEKIGDYYIKELKAVVNKPAAFKKVAERMVEETMKPENHQMYYEVIEGIMKETVISGIIEVCFGDTARGRRVEVSFAAVELSINVIKEIKLWWEEKCSGETCVKNICDEIAGTAGSLAGGRAAVRVWARVSPRICALIGATGCGFSGAAFVVGVLGAVGAYYAARALSDQLTSPLADKLTKWMFGLSREKALENSYIFLGIKENVSKSDLNIAYTHLALQYNPDKGGDEDKFLQLQYSMALIKVASGE